MSSVTTIRRRVAVAATVFLAATAAAGPALAHTYGAAGAGLATGFAHPFGGIDHLLVMLAAGAGAARLAGRARYGALAAFAGMMALGGVAGISGLAVPAAEWLIALSVVAAGMIVALQRRRVFAAGAVLLAAFAIVHGNVHGLEAPAAAEPILYTLGFLGGTLVLLTAGFGLGLTAPSVGRRAWRVAGAVTAATGIALIAGV